MDISSSSFVELVSFKTQYYIYFLKQMIKSKCEILSITIELLIEAYSTNNSKTWVIFDHIYGTIYSKTNCWEDHYCRISPDCRWIAYISRSSKNKLQLILRYMFEEDYYPITFDYEVDEGEITFLFKWLDNSVLYIVSNSSSIGSEIVSIHGKRKSLKDIFDPPGGNSCYLQYNEEYKQLMVNYSVTDELRRRTITGHNIDIYSAIYLNDLLSDSLKYIQGKKIGTIEYATYLSRIDRYNLICVDNRIEKNEFMMTMVGGSGSFEPEISTLFIYNTETKQRKSLLDIHTDVNPDEFEFTVWSNQLFISDRNHLYYPTGREKLCQFLKVKPTYGYNFISDHEMEKLMNQWFTRDENMEQYKLK